MAAVTADWDTQRHFLLGAECSKSLCTSLLASLFFFGRVGECSQCESNSDSCSESESPLGLDLQLINRSLFTPPPAVTRSLSALIRLHNTLMLVSCLSWQTEKLLLRKLSRTLPGKTLQCRKRKKIKKILISASSFCCTCFCFFCFFLGYLRQCALKLYEPAPSSLSFYGQSPLAIC